MYILRILFCFLALFSLASAGEPAAAALKVPRFVSLKSADVNARAGPGTRYPIVYVYHHAGMPVEIVAEFEEWRKIHDVDGSAGWVHKAMVSGVRTAVVRGKKAQIFRSSPEDDGRKLFQAEPMVMGKLLECKPTWCRMLVGDHKGWIKKQLLWGVYATETLP